MNLKVLVHAPEELTEQLANTSEKFRDMQFLRSWFELDSEVSQVRPSSRNRVNWNLVMGLAVMGVVSGGFWAGVGLLIAQAR
jgi:uncharacterized membrane protein